MYAGFYTVSHIDIYGGSIARHARKYGDVSVACPKGKYGGVLIAQSLNVVVEWLALLLRIREVPGSNLGQDTSCPEFVRGFPQSLQPNAGIVP
jgi:hypothetical protein